MLGEVEESDIVPLLQAGELRPSDFYQASGMVERRPLIDFIDVATGEKTMLPKRKKKGIGIEISQETYSILRWLISLPFLMGLFWLIRYLMSEWLIPFFEK